MNQRFIRMRELCSTPGLPGRLPISPNTVWRLVREGTFPQPVKLTDNVTAWRLEDVEQWEADRERSPADTGKSSPSREGEGAAA